MSKLTAHELANEFERISETDGPAWSYAARMILTNLCEIEDESRERFEAWINATSIATWPHSFDRRGDKYVNNWYQSRWEAWQAALTWRASE